MALQGERESDGNQAACGLALYTFEFGEEVLHYTHRTMTLTRGRAISYACIELEERSTLVKQNLWFFVAGVALAFGGLIVALVDGGLSAQILTWTGALASLWGLRKTRYVLIDVERKSPFTF